MKFWGVISAVAALQLAAFAPALASAEDGLPETGTYYILNGLSEEALQPPMSSVGQNVLMYKYDKSGAQKWSVNRRVDPVTSKPTNKYDIKLAGDSTQLYLHPHPIANSTAILSNDSTVYILQPEADAVAVRSVERNGDAMYMISNPPMNAEVHFGAKEESPKFRWKFVKADW